jgi:diguanylate cyclase (GGDEF)-like protein
MIAKLRILLVEDNPADARLIREHLTEAGKFQFELVHKNRLSTGLQHLKEAESNKNPFDLVLLDLTLPDSGDLETIVSFRRETNLPIIVQTGLEDEDLAIKVVQEGAQDYLIKGQITSALLVRSIRYAIERKRTELTIEHRAQELAALYDTSLEISSNLEIEKVLRAIVERASRLVGVHMGGLYLVTADEKHIQLVAGYNVPDQLIGVTLKIGEGLSGRVVETGRAIAINDYKDWEGKSSVFDMTSFRRVLAVPLRSGKKVIGTINVSDDDISGAFSEEDIRLSNLFADQASIAVQNARLFESSQKHARQLALLNDITQAGLSSASFNEMLNTVATRFVSLIDADSVYITLWDKDQQITKPTLAIGILENSFPTLKFGQDEITLSASVLDAGHSIAIQDVSSSTLLNKKMKDLMVENSILGLPMIADEKKIGAVIVGFNKTHIFSPEEINICEQASNQIALVLARFQALEAETQRSQELARSNALIKGLSQVAAHLETSLDPQEIMNFIGSELKPLGISIQIALYEDGLDDLRQYYSSIKPDQVEIFKKQTGAPFKIDQTMGDTWPLSQVVGEKKAFFHKNLYPAMLNWYSEKENPNIIAGLVNLGFSPQTTAIYLPLMIKDNVFGVLVVWADMLQENDVPAFLIFANQTAIAIENSRLYAHIQKLASGDELTGLFNRRGFFSMADQQLKLAVRMNLPVLLVFLDLDQLKFINDTYGHQEGDQALIEIAGVLTQTFRGSDIIARMGGDEFAVLAVNAPENESITLSERIREKLDRLNLSKIHPYEIAVSIGMTAWAPGRPIDLDELLVLADSIMYAQKEEHRKKLIRRQT